MGKKATSAMPRLRFPSPAQEKLVKADNATSGFRARLRSPDEESDNLVAEAVPHPCDTPFNVYERLGACFALEPSPPPTEGPSLHRTKKQLVADPKSDVIRDLTESFTQAGVDLHASASESLVQANAYVAERISQFRDKYTDILKSHDALYDNIGWPLSATLCSSNNLPKRSIEAHLLNLQKQVDDTMEKLQRLGQE